MRENLYEGTEGCRWQRSIPKLRDVLEGALMGALIGCLSVATFLDFSWPWLTVSTVLLRILFLNSFYSAISRWRRTYGSLNKWCGSSWVSLFPNGSAAQTNWDPMMQFLSSDCKIVWTSHFMFVLHMIWCSLFFLVCKEVLASCDLYN